MFKLTKTTRDSPPKRSSTANVTINESKDALNESKQLDDSKANINNQFLNKQPSSKPLLSFFQLRRNKDTTIIPYNLPKSTPDKKKEKQEKKEKKEKHSDSIKQEKDYSPVSYKNTSKVHVQEKMINQQVETFNPQQQIFDNCFKPFIIQQNVKKFANKIMQKIHYFRKVKAKHFEVINDKAANYNASNYREDHNMYLLVTRQSKGNQCLNRISKFAKKVWHKCDKWCCKSLRNHASQRISKIASQVPIIQPESRLSLYISIVLSIIQIFYILIIPLDISFKSALLTDTLLYVNMLFQVIFGLSILVNFTKYEDCYKSMNQGAILRGAAGAGPEDHLQDLPEPRLPEGSHLAPEPGAGTGGVGLRVLAVGHDPLLLADVVALPAQGGADRQKHIHQELEAHPPLPLLDLPDSLRRAHLRVHLLLHQPLFLQARQLLIHRHSLGYSSFYENYDLNNMNWVSQYIVEIYFASTTMITVGYGDMTPQNNGEQLFCVFFMLGSSILLSFSVNTIGSIIEEIKIGTEENNKKIRLINDYMAKKNITQTLQIRIREYLQYYWREEEQETQLEQQQEIINQLPEYLKMMLLKEAYSQVITDCPLFQNFQFSDNFKKQIYEIIKSINLLPMSIVEAEKQKNDLEGPCIYYVDKGGIDVSVFIEVMVQNGANFVKVNEFVEKQYFGLDEFVSNQEQNVIFRSNKFTRLQIIPKNRFYELLTKYNQDKEVFTMIKDDYFYNNEEVLKHFAPYCVACRTTTHNLQNCPLVHYIPDKEKIMKSYLYLNIQIRNHLKRKTKKNFFQTLPDRKFMEDCVEAFLQENFKFTKNLYEDPSQSSQSSEQDGDSSSEEESDPEPPKVDSRPAYSVNIRDSNMSQLEQISEETENDAHHLGYIDLDQVAPVRNSFQSRKESAKLNAFLVSSNHRRSILQKFQKQNNVQDTQSQPSAKNQPPKPKGRKSIFQNLVQKAIQAKDIKKQQLHKFQNMVQQAQEQAALVQKPKKTIYNDFRLMLGQLEKYKDVYLEKMNHYYNKKDRDEFEMLLVRLRLLFHCDLTGQEIFEFAKSYQHYKPMANVHNMIRQFEVIYTKGKKLFQLDQKVEQQDLQLSSYLFFPFQYIMKYRVEKTKQLQENYDGSPLTNASRSERKSFQERKHKRAVTKVVSNKSLRKLNQE